MLNPFTALRCYYEAWELKAVFFGVHLVVRLMAYALVSPLIGGLVNLGVSFSDQSALTDQAIAGFILTPVGAIATLLVISVLISAEILGFAIMTGVLRSNDSNGWRALRGALAQIASRVGPLIIFAVLLVVRLVAMIAPFAVAALLVAQRYLTEYDINYYLTFHPPEFFKAVALIAPILLVAAALVLNRGSAWALALHYVLFNNESARSAFTHSATAMDGHRLRLQRDIVFWALIRVAFASAIGLIVGLVVAILPVDTSTGLRLVLLVMAILVGLWGLAGLVLSAVSLGALAVLFNQQFDEAGDVATGRIDSSARLAINPKLVAPVLVGLAAFGLWAGVQLLDNVKTDDNVEIIAHRGGAGARPENTMASIEKGIEDKSDWIEIDVQESADNELIVVHDSDFMKLAGVNVKVWDVTLPELADIDIGSWFDPAYDAERTPLLRDVLELAKGRAKVLIELKYYGHDIDLENRVIAMVEELGMADQVATMSLKYPAVQKMIALRPDWRAGVLAATAVGNLSGLDGDFIAVSKAMATPRLVRSTNAANKDLYVWTINDPLEMSSMISKGVDGLITDEPEMAHRVLAFRAQLSTPERLFLWLAEAIGLDLNRKEYRDNQP